MSKKSAAQLDAERRADARRRARLQAQGRILDEEDEEPAPAAAQRPAAPFFQRFFPPAAPLPGKPDPLGDFTYQGPMRMLAENLWLIRRNLVAGVAMGAVFAMAILLTPGLGALGGTIASFGSLGALLAAGWIGWQRPWLYGLVAAVVGNIFYSAYAVYVWLTVAPSSQGPSAGQLALILLLNTGQYAVIGAVAGLYAGYMRRRVTDASSRQAAPARRRR